MSRLTVKTKKGYMNNIPNSNNLTLFEKGIKISINKDAIFNKLGQIEDIEEELGIDALLYLKVMSHQVIYVKGMEPIWGGVGDESDIESYHVMRFTKDRLEVRFACSDTYATHVIENPLDLYGKVWAVTKEELS